MSGLTVKLNKMYTLKTTNHTYPILKIKEIKEEFQSVVKELQRGIKLYGSCKMKSTDGSNRIIRAKPFSKDPNYILCLEYINGVLENRVAIDIR